MNVTWTCYGCPMQAEGQLDDGRWFYFRYRWGHATFGVGADLVEAIRDENTAGMSYGDSYQGVLSSEEADELLRRTMLLRLTGGFAMNGRNADSTVLGDNPLRVTL